MVLLLKSWFNSFNSRWLDAMLDAYDFKYDPCLTFN